MKTHVPEQVLRPGPNGHLLAIWTPPVGEAKPLAVVLLNAGVIHRVGPHRLHVKLARRLSALGWGCLRFDLSGVGDSQAPRNAADFRTQAGQDIRSVLDILSEQMGYEAFALVGLCSGAAHAQAAALADPRVKAVFLIDGYMYPTWRARLNFMHRMGRAYGWPAALGRIVRGVLMAHRRAADAAEATPSLAPPEPHRSPNEFDQDMQLLYERGVRVSLLFTGSVLEVFAYPEQLRELFPRAAWLNHVQCWVEPEVDHTITLRASQLLLQQRIEDWLAERAPARGPHLEV